MAWWLWVAVGIYGLGFIFTFWLNGQAGMITLGLCLVRALVWPIWLVTGWPQGEPI